MVISVEIQLVVLDARGSATRGNAIKQSTKHNILTHINSYEEFCRRYALNFFLADNRQLCRFGQHLISNKQFRSADLVGNYLSGIRTCHAILGFTTPDVQEKNMQWFSQGVQRTLIHEVRQAQPITPELLLRISTVVNYTDQIEMVSWVAVLLGFTLFLRKSNLVPDSMDTFNPELQFRRADLNVVDPLKAMMAEIRWSKTNQFKKKILRLPILPVKNKTICPVLWTHYMVSTVHALPQDLIFTIHHMGVKKSLSANQLVNRLRKWLGLIKENGELLSLHSLQ